MSSASPFDKLPTELLKRIVDFVKEQDERTALIQVARATPAELSAGEEDDEDSEEEEEVPREDIKNGRFPSAYGRGLSATSLTSKTLRALSLPHLLKTVRSHQLEKAFFRFLVLTSPLAGHIEYLNMAGASESGIVAAAQAIPLLPNLRGLSVTSSITMSFLFPRKNDPELDWRSEADEAKRKSKKERAELRAMATILLRTHLRKLTQLDLPFWGRNEAIKTLEDVAGDRLSEVSLNGRYLQTRDAGSRLRYVLERLPLTKLVIAGISPNTSKPLTTLGWLSNLRLKQLTTLDLYLPSGPAPPFAALEQLDAPHLSRLTLRTSHGFEHPSPMRQLYLPRLKVLTLNPTPLSQLEPVLAVFPLSPITSLVVDHRAFHTLDCGEILPLSAPHPTTLRTLHFDLPHYNLPEDSAEYRNARAQQNIIFTLSTKQHAGILQDTFEDVEDEEAEEDLKTTRKRAEIDETLAWASREVESVCTTGDVVGLQQLGEALVRVKQLKMLKEV